jgi:hypothetical protein
MYEKHAIRSIDDLIKKLDPLFETNKRLWFRGHPENINYKLEPSVYRGRWSPEKENDLMNMFKSRAVPYLINLPRTDWEWLFIMQHYKVPTRLLDWTESALIALAFAVYDRLKEHEDAKAGAAVWCLKPYELNKNFTFLRKSEIIPNINENKMVQNMFAFDSSDDPTFPVAIVGPQNSNRVIAQKGVFTLFPIKEKQVMEDITNCNEFLVKFTIDENDVAVIKKQLYNLGITESSIYPELESVAREIQHHV